MKPKMIMQMDELGRIPIPREFRNALCWDGNTKLAVTQDNNEIIIKPYKDSCLLCGNETEIRNIHGKFICKTCIHEMLFRTDKQ